MIFRALTPTGDWTLGQGIQCYLRDEKAVELNVQTRLKSFLGDCFWATEFGVDWWELLGVKNPSAQAAIVLACRLMIAESYGVVRINSIAASTNPTTRRLTVTYSIDTIYSRSVVGTVSP